MFKFLSCEKEVQTENTRNYSHSGTQQTNKNRHGNIIVEAQARYGEDWCIYKTEYSSFSFN